MTPKSLLEPQLVGALCAITSLFTPVAIGRVLEPILHRSGIRVAEPYEWQKRVPCYFLNQNRIYNRAEAQGLCSAEFRVLEC